MEQITLDASFVTKGIPHVAFWNGRVLTADDLRDEQLANQLGRGRLGRAVGSGIVSGLVARPGPGPALVDVTAGSAVDRLGQVVELPVDVRVSLVVPPEPAGGDGLFTVCEPVTSTTPTGTGLYLLVIRPASEPRSSVAGVPAFGDGIATECGPRYTVDGAAFRLVGIDVTGLADQAGHDDADDAVLASLGTPVESDLARNVVAHLFLDTQAWRRLLVDPFGAPSGEVERGALAALAEGPLLPCEVPIAVISWSFGGIGFVDPWAVRRPCRTSLAFSAVQSLGDPQREVLGRASFGQFQEQLAAVRAGLTIGQRALFALTDRFRYLPAAGLVPVAKAGRPGFSPAVVFGDLVVRGPVGLAAARVGAILDESFHHPAIDVASGEVLYVYAVDESASGTPDHLVFCTSRMEFLGDELVIDAVFPGGLLQLGQQIEVRGRGFGFSTGGARVRFGTTAAAALPGSNDSRLLVVVPTSLVVEPDGTQVTLEVTNGVDTDSVPIMVGHRQQPVLGDLHVTWSAVEPRRIERGEPVSISYTVRSALNQSAEVDIELGGAPPELVAAAELLDAGGGQLDQPITLDPDDTVTIIVSVDPVPDVEDFTVGLGVRAGDVTGADTRTFATDSDTLPADPAIVLLVDDFDVDTGTGTATMDGDTIRMTDGAIANVEILVRVTEPGDYEVRVVPTDLSGPWRSVLSEPADGMFEDIPASEIDQTGFASRRARVTVQRAGAPPTSTVSIIVQRPGRPDDARRTFTLQAT